MIDLFEDDACLYMVLEYLDGGELFDQVERLQRVPEDDARRYMWQVVQGTKYLHSRYVMGSEYQLYPGFILLLFYDCLWCF